MNFKAVPAAVKVTAAEGWGVGGGGREQLMLSEGGGSWCLCANRSAPHKHARFLEIIQTMGSSDGLCR